MPWPDASPRPRHLIERRRALDRRGSRPSGARAPDRHEATVAILELERRWNDERRELRLTRASRVQPESPHPVAEGLARAPSAPVDANERIGGGEHDPRRAADETTETGRPDEVVLNVSTSTGSAAYSGPRVSPPWTTIGPSGSGSSRISPSENALQYSLPCTWATRARPLGWVGNRDPCSCIKDDDHEVVRSPCRTDGSSRPGAQR